MLVEVSESTKLTAIHDGCKIEYTLQYKVKGNQYHHLFSETFYLIYFPVVDRECLLITRSVLKLETDGELGRTPPCLSSS